MTRSRTRVLVLTYTPFVREPRALKQATFLREKYDVTTAGFGPQPLRGVEHVELAEVDAYRWGVVGRLAAAALMLVRWYGPLRALSNHQRNTARLLGGREWDIVIAHDLKTLDAALRLRSTSGVILDLHEYAPRQEEHSRRWRALFAPYYRWLCHKVVPKTAAVVTVGEGIAAEYKKQFGIDSTVTINASPYAELKAGKVTRPIRLVHSGGVAVQRRLEIMIEGVRASDADVTLDLYLVSEADTLLSSLKETAAGDPRIRFCDPVPYDQLVSVLNDYDIGLSIFPPTTFNLAWCLPNKFFDYVQARLGIIIGPSPEMTTYIERLGNGLVLADFEASSLARALEALEPAQVQAWKLSSHRHARELSSESQAALWEDLVARVLDQRSA